ncbi:MAG: esterase-like activity of phytase family protein [Pseudomonadota bacterium]
MMTSGAHGQLLKNVHQSRCIRWLRYGVAALWLSLSAPVCAQTLPSMPAGAYPLDIRIRSVPLNPEDPRQTGVGKLRYLGGLELLSPLPGFGGLSGLAVAADESHFIAISDRSAFICGRIGLDRSDALTRVSDAWIAPMKPANGVNMKVFKYTDSEAIAIAADSTAAFVSFEREHRVWRYDIADTGDLCSIAQAIPVLQAMPDALNALPNNGGIESLTVLPSGTLLALAENAPRGGLGQPGWLVDVVAGHPEPARTFNYPAPVPYKPTDVEAVPGGLFILHRHFSVISGVSGQLAWLPLRDRVTAEQFKAAVLLAQFKPPLSVDNFEGLSAVADGKGGYYLYIVSDDNFADYQRTLLMKFHVSPAALAG